MTTPTIRRALPVLLVVAAACASSAPAVKPTEEPRPEGRARRAEKAAEAQAAPAPEAMPARAQRLFNEALKTLEDQKALKVPVDWALMERKWRAVVETSDVAEAWFNVGVALENQGKAADAKAAYEKALAVKPGLRQARVNLAVLQERSGDVRGASAAYADILREHPEDAMARERMAALYLSSGQNDDAWNMAREALLRDPRSVGAYKTMIRVALHRKDYDVAKLIALRAQKLAESDADVAYLLAQVLSEQGDDAAASAQFAKVLALAPNHVPSRYALLDQAVRKEAWPKVVEQADGILAEDPKSAPVTLLRGIALRHTDKPDQALEAYARAESLAGGTLPEVFLARGVLLMREKNECEPALAEFDRYVKASGPILPKGSPVPALQRECDEQIAANKAAAEAARQMQLEAEKAAAAEAAKKAAEEAAKKAAEEAAKNAPPEAAKPPAAAEGAAGAPSPTPAPKVPAKKARPRAKAQ